MRVLLVEDDHDLAEAVVRGLRQEHLAVDRAASFHEATTCMSGTHYDVVCLDLGLPDGDGLDLCGRLRGPDPDRSLTRPDRLLVLTARDAVADRVAGLDAGADDYLVKPFTIAELAARIRALTRRQDQVAGPIEVDGLLLDPAAHSVRRDGRPVHLTSREFALLRYLVQHAGVVVSSEQLLEHCWDSNANAFTGSVRVILSRLRSKLGEPAVIHTIKGAGYRLGAPR